MKNIFNNLSPDQNNASPGHKVCEQVLQHGKWKNFSFLLSFNMFSHAFAQSFQFTCHRLGRHHHPSSNGGKVMSNNRCAMYFECVLCMFVPVKKQVPTYRTKFMARFPSNFSILSHSKLFYILHTSYFSKYFFLGLFSLTFNFLEKNKKKSFSFEAARYL